MAKNSPGYLLPEIPQPDENICVCVPVPKDWRHIQAFLGQIVQLGYWYTWERDTAHTGRLAAEKWREIYECISEEINCAMANNCGCDGNNPVLLRYNPVTGRLEQSTDGGETWHDAPDPRYDSPLLPPHVGDTVDDIKCITAANAVEYFKTQLIDQATEWSTLAQVAAAIIAIVLGVITGGLGSALAVELASIFIQAGISAAVAAFTSDVYERFRCNLYCHSLPDGSWDADAIAAIRTRLNIEETATALSILQSWLDQLGPAGLTNSGRLNLVSDADCSGCECGCYDGCEPVFTAYQYNDPKWTTHGAYTRFSAFTPPGSYDSFELGSSSAVLTFDTEQCITYVGITVNNGCPYPDGAKIKLYVGGVSYGEQIPYDKAPTDPTGCLDPSCEWHIPLGASGTTVRFEQTGTPCAGGYDNLVICTRIGACP